MQSDARTGFRLSTLVDSLVHREPRHASDRKGQAPDFQRKKWPARPGTTRSGQPDKQRVVMPCGDDQSRISISA